MKNRIILSLLLSAFALSSFQINNGGGSKGFKCLIQLKNYQGKEAYVIVSIVNSKGEYQETLKVLGDDKEWHPDIKAWYKHRESIQHKPSVDGVTGASIISGGRSVVSLSIANKYINSGYSLRFESAVENKVYHQDDVSLDLSDATLKAGKFEGTKGYIRQIRLIPIQK